MFGVCTVLRAVSAGYYPGRARTSDPGNAKTFCQPKSATSCHVFCHVLPEPALGALYLSIYLSIYLAELGYTVNTPLVGREVLVYTPITYRK